MGTIFLAVLTIAFALPANDRSPLESGDVREIHIGAPAGALVDHFVLEDDGGERAVARFSRWKLEGGGTRLELETRLLDSDLVVSHVERIEPKRRLMTWRERSSAGVRSVFLDGTADLLGWVGEGRHHRRLEIPAHVVLPLEWLATRLDTARSERTPPVDRFTTLDPLSAGLREVEVRHDSSGACHWWSDGRSAERWEVAEGQLIGFTWRSSLVRARRIPSAEYAQRLQASRTERTKS